MKRCPKHPDTIQTQSDKCEVWVGGIKMQCGHALEPLSATELQEIRTKYLKDALEKTTLPSWVVAGIQEIAWDQGHACGQQEVDNYVLDWLGTLETLQQKAEA